MLPFARPHFTPTLLNLSPFFPSSLLSLHFLSPFIPILLNLSPISPSPYLSLSLYTSLLTFR